MSATRQTRGAVWIVLALSLSFGVLTGCRVTDDQSTGPSDPGTAATDRETQSALATEKSAPGPEAFPHLEGADLENGKRIYTEGRTRSGAEIEAIVAGDVRVSGTQLTCVSCHQKSGMGTSEGWTVVPMVTARALFSEKKAGARPRPAYDVESLGRVIRDGVDSTGAEIDALMPKYDLSKSDERDLIAYLAQLSRDHSPGVEAEVLHLATVVGPEVDASASLEVLERFVDEKNNDLRRPLARARTGAYFRKHRDEAYRKWKLHVWRLEGPPESYRAQLEAFQRERPVFALLSGKVAGSWDPIEEFCEAWEIPCLLPNTDRPGDDRDRAYSLYFSEGVAIEARAIAEQIASLDPGSRVLQFARAGDPLFDLFREAARQRGLTVVDRAVPVDQPIRAAYVERQVEIESPASVVFWLTRPDLLGVTQWIDHEDPPESLYLSSSLLGDLAEPLPAVLEQCAALAHPFTLPGEFDRRFLRVSVWLRRAKIEIRDRRDQAQSYFACLLLGEALMHFRHDFYYREFLLESIDHIIGLPAFSVAHPTPSFGPGQRILSKGCYLLSPGTWRHMRGADWMVPEAPARWMSGEAGAADPTPP